MGKPKSSRRVQREALERMSDRGPRAEPRFDIPELDDPYHGMSAEPLDRRELIRQSIQAFERTGARGMHTPVFAVLSTELHDERPFEELLSRAGAVIAHDHSIGAHHPIVIIVDDHNHVVVTPELRERMERWFADFRETLDAATAGMKRMAEALERHPILVSRLSVEELELEYTRDTATVVPGSDS